SRIQIGINRNNWSNLKIRTPSIGDGIRPECPPRVRTTLMASTLPHGELLRYCTLGQLFQIVIFSTPL
ncbi:hypothetical protein, partial [Sinorhizobium meliloti]|uniref:hypothetical protein n=1 Tax=Rhizobium meliloti TaxID=382 RepID=UPI001AECEC8B